MGIVEICNMALSHIGHSQYIDSIDERSKEADVCKLFYNQVKQEMLRDTRPSFARVREALALVQEKPNRKWEYQYRYPTTALNIINLDGDFNERINFRDRIPFEIGFSGSVKSIYTNEKDAVAVYIDDVDESIFDSMFINLVSARLATMLAMPMAVDASLRANAEQLYQSYKNQAMTAAANEMQQERQPDSEFVQEYYGYGYTEDKRRW